MTKQIENVWNIICDDELLTHYCLNPPNEQFFTAYHPKYKINVLQWCLWYIGSSTNAFNSFPSARFGNMNRKDWAFDRIRILHENLSRKIWRDLVHMNTEYSNKCKTVHYFFRNCHIIDKIHLDYINKWLDEVDGRMTYTYSADEYGHTPKEYINFHKERSRIFKKKWKERIDNLVKKYHFYENNLRLSLDIPTMKDFYEGLKEVNNTDDIYEDIGTRIQIVEILKIRIEAYIIHENLFNDRLKEIEKKEESLNRGLTQMSNHLWMINAYRKLIKGTTEGNIIENFIKNKKLSI